MESPLPSGTILQNRYNLLSVLGQGGFGRTYLAEDQGRFNERCALKELIPPETGAYALEKSKELFQREATTLYQIKHPQVPQFRANFEQDGRLFLVQDYVEGKTYRELLNERKAQTVVQPTNVNPASTPNQNKNGVFSESEVRSLLLQLLPVLDHLHSKSIIHRDITPDNIILRESDRMPVLIDFGVVKELATRFLAPNTSAPLTTVGKVGYAPSEQIQTGRAYPSSDLYSLAVSAVVLLTGKEPQSLFDDNQLTWSWRSLVDVSDDFASVINRMLSYRPGDRYQSANEVLQALQSPQAAAPPLPVQPPLPIPQRPDPNASQAATMAVGRRPESPGQRNPRIPEPTSNSITENPWIIIGLGTALALVAGLGAWAITSALRGDPQEQVADTSVETPTLAPTPIPTETLSPTPTPTTTPIATPEPTPTPQATTTPQASVANSRLTLNPGQSLTRSGNIKANSTLNYIIRGVQNESLSAALAGEGVLMTVIAPDQNPISDEAVRVQRWEGKLLLTGEYTIQLRPVKGASNSEFKLTLGTEKPATPASSPSPSPSPTSTQAVEYKLEQVSLPGGLGSQQLIGSTSPQKIKRYLINVKKGQILSVEVPQTVNASVDVRFPNGKLIPQASGAKSWQEPVPRNGEYKIDVIASQKTDFELKVSVSK